MQRKMKARNDKEQAHCKLVHIDVLKSEKSVNGSTKLSDSNDDGFELPKLYYFVLLSILIIPIFPVLYILIYLKRLFRLTRKKLTNHKLINVVGICYSKMSSNTNIID
jgi:hypothetical protein